MKREQLVATILKKQSYLSVGLDSDIERLPSGVSQLDFNKAIIDATRDTCVSYKMNSAFYEVCGSDGWRTMEETIKYIGDDHFIILDAKRGDIGNTSRQYAKAAFEQLGAHAVTIAPYMGRDSVQPFLDFEGCWSIILALTSNQGSQDFQQIKNENGQFNYETVLERCASWGQSDNMMFVVGATKPEGLAQIRSTFPEHFFLVPGVGAQGGSLQAVAQAALTDFGGLIVNSSRGIIFADVSGDYAQAAQVAANDLHEQMKSTFKLLDVAQ